MRATSILDARHLVVVTIGTMSLGVGGVLGTLVHPLFFTAGVTVFGGIMLGLVAHNHERGGRTLWRVSTRGGGQSAPRPSTATVVPLVAPAGELDRALANQSTVLRARFETALEELRAELQTAMQEPVSDVDERVQPELDRLAQGLDGLRDAIRRCQNAIERGSARTVQELDALLRLQDVCPLPERIQPALVDRWAMAPSAILDVVRLVRREQPDLVVECGSGTSTVFLAHTLRDTGGRLVSLEHKQDIADGVDQILTDAGLVDQVDLRCGPLESGSGEFGDGDWYPRRLWEDLAGIDLLLIDGPPGGGESNARGEALPALWERLSPEATIVVDDAQRAEEQAFVARWEASYPLRRLPSLAPGHLLLRSQRSAR